MPTHPESDCSEAAADDRMALLVGSRKQVRVQVEATGVFAREPWHVRYQPKHARQEHSTAQCTHVPAARLRVSLADLMWALETHCVQGLITSSTSYHNRLVLGGDVAPSIISS
jgi:hypothetical protein